MLTLACETLKVDDNHTESELEQRSKEIVSNIEKKIILSYCDIEAARCS